MKSTSLLLFAICLLCGLVLSSGCTQHLWTEAQGFPDNEIVFEINTELSTDSPIGFIRPDGSGLITRTVNLGGNAALPTWSPDGNFIAFRASPTSGSYFQPMRPRVISSEDNVLGLCKEWEWSSGRIWITTDDKLLMPLNLKDEEHRSIVLADITSCKILSTLYTASEPPDKEFLDSAHLSSQGLLAIGRVLKQTFPVEAEIVIVDPLLQETRIVGYGLAPSWSRDGEWLAYTTVDGINVVRKDGSETRKVVEMDFYGTKNAGFGWLDLLPIASWSPDGKWLVYHRMTSAGPIIFKANVETKEEVKLFEGGIYPNWRWDLYIDSNGD